MPLARIPKRLRFYEDATKVATTTVTVAAMRRMVNYNVRRTWVRNEIEKAQTL